MDAAESSQKNSQKNNYEKQLEEADGENEVRRKNSCIQSYLGQVWTRICEARMKKKKALRNQLLSRV